MKMNFKLLIFITFALSAILFGIALGEESFFPGPEIALGTFSLLILFPIGWFLGKTRRASRWGFAAALPLLFLFAWIAGSFDLRQAYRDCERNSDQLRADLTQYRDHNGNFPLSLNQLGWPRLPGGRLLGKSILHYDFGIKSYRMYFSPQKRTGLWNSCSFPRKK